MYFGHKKVVLYMYHDTAITLLNILSSSCIKIRIFTVMVDAKRICQKIFGSL